MQGADPEERSTAIPGIDYCFTPFVAVSLREDGRVDVRFDWSDSYVYSHDNYDHRIRRKRSWHWAPYADDIGEALDSFIKRNPSRFIIELEGD